MGLRCVAQVAPGEETSRRRQVAAHDRPGLVGGELANGARGAVVAATQLDLAGGAGAYGSSLTPARFGRRPAPTRPLSGWGPADLGMERCPMCGDTGLVLDTKPVVGREMATPVRRRTLP
jgi:hypothetical protein